MTTILVVEDEFLVRENLRELLSAEGFRVLLAADGEEGVQAARSHLPDLILCDIRMPRLDGYGVLARLNRDPLTETIPFIFLTARAERSDHRMAMALGADDFISKPFTRMEVLSSIRTRLERQRVLQRAAQEKVLMMQSGIARRLPDNLLAPLSVILGNAELLADSGQHASDAVQVRSVARTIRRAAFRLTRLVRSYLLYQNLEPLLLDPQGKERLMRERAEVRRMDVETLVRDLAREWGREEDVQASIQDVILHISEEVFFSLLEELVDQALRQSRLGVRVSVEGFRRAGIYRLEVRTQGGGDPASLLLASQEDTPFGLLLARRIVEVYGGQLSIADALDGDSRITLDFPRPIG